MTETAAPAVRLLVTGAGGQAGRALLRSCPVTIECVALTHAQLDITDEQAVNRILDEVGPQAVINAAAWTDVDGAEQKPERAALLNAVAPGRLAAATAKRGMRLLHISTDFVFAGAAGTNFGPQALPVPEGVYAHTKRDGEQAVLNNQPRALVLRTAWLYGSVGHNFVTTMLRLMRAGGPVRVVSDQLGTPTAVDGLARALWRAWQKNLSGIHHWTDAGVASWYDFAVAIGEEARQAGLLTQMPEVIPVSTADYATPAPRPACSVLDKTQTWAALEMRPPHWRIALRAVLRQMAQREGARA